MQPSGDALISYGNPPEQNSSIPENSDLSGNSIEQGASAQQIPADPPFSTSRDPSEQDGRTYTAPNASPNPLSTGSNPHTPAQPPDQAKSPIPPHPSVEVTRGQASITPDPPNGLERRSSSIPTIDNSFSDSEVEDAGRPEGLSLAEAPGNRADPRTTSPNIPRGRRAERFHEKTVGIVRRKPGGRTVQRVTSTITESNVSYSSDESSRVRIERLRQRKNVDEDSDEDGATPVSSRAWIQRATLLETKGTRVERTEEDITNDRRSKRAQRVRCFSFMSEGKTKWVRFLNALEELHKEERKYFLVILEGAANKHQIRDLERGGLRGIKRLLKKQTSARNLPSTYNRGLIFDVPFLPSTEHSTARYIGVWIPDDTKSFAVLFDPHINTVSAQGLEDENSITKNILHHYTAAKRWSRYETYRMWLVIDLYSTLYIKMWNKRNEELAEQIEKDRDRTIDYFTEAPITLLSLSLHERQSSLLSLLELKRYQEAAFQRIDIFFDNLESVRVPEGFSFRLQSTIHQEGLSQKAIDLLLKKVDDSINLVGHQPILNEARTINRLTYLAFVFVPLSFATSVWGMTEFQIAAKWIATFALPLLFVTVIIAWISHKLARKLDYWKVKRMDRKDNGSAQSNV